MNANNSKRKTNSCHKAQKKKKEKVFLKISSKVHRIIYMTVCLIKHLYMPLFIEAIDIYISIYKFYRICSNPSTQGADVHTLASSDKKKWSLGFPYYKVTTAVCLIFKDNNPISYGDVLIG